MAGRSKSPFRVFQETVRARLAAQTDAAAFTQVNRRVLRSTSSQSRSPLAVKSKPGS
jgi:hypothetical protein